MLAVWTLLGLTLTAAAPAAYCTGQRTVDDFGVLYYPNGQQARTSTGTCYFETGVEMKPCQRVVSIRDRLPGGETAFYQLDVAEGAIDLRNVRYEFPSGAAVTTLIADLAAGRLDRASIAAVC